MDIGEDYSHLYAGEIKKSKKKIYTDGLKAIAYHENVDTIRRKVMKSRDNVSALLLRGERTSFFVTEDSKKYISTRTEKYAQKNYILVDAAMRFDSVHVRYKKKHVVGEMRIQQISAYTAQISDVVENYRAALRITMSPMRMYQVSLGGAMIFGMVSMSMIYQNLGPNVFAEGLENVMTGGNDVKEVVRVIENESDEDTEKVEDKKESDIEKKEEVIKKDEKDELKNKEHIEVVQEHIQDEVVEEKATPVIMADIVPVKETILQDASSENGGDSKEKSVATKSVDSVINKDEQVISERSLEELAYETVKGHPIEKMLPYILEQDPEVAKYLIAIAKQESGWGEHVPVLNGQDCYNYWGYRGQRKLMGTGGHTCFNSRKDAVETVAKRLHTLIYENERSTASKLIVWKCGSSCAGHAQEGVDRWINVVDSYHKKLSQK